LKLPEKKRLMKKITFSKKMIFLHNSVQENLLRISTQKAEKEGMQ